MMADKYIDHILVTRPGERVAKRRRCKSRIGANHKIQRDETVKWFKNRFEVCTSIYYSRTNFLVLMHITIGYCPINFLHTWIRMKKGVNG